MNVWFEDIEARIIKEMTKHTHCWVASAWLTSKTIIERLRVMKSRAVIGKDMCQNMGGIETLLLEREGTNMMHHKFMLLGDSSGPKVCINGSYNFTENAKNNDENTMLISNPAVVAEFFRKFEAMFPPPPEVCLDYVIMKKTPWGYHYSAQECPSHKQTSRSTYHCARDNEDDNYCPINRYPNDPTRFEVFETYSGETFLAKSYICPEKGVWSFGIDGNNENIPDASIKIRDSDTNGDGEVRLMQEVMVWWLLSSGMSPHEMEEIAQYHERNRYSSPECSEVIPSSSNGQKLEALRTFLGDCERCGLCESRTHILFGQGNPDARIMFIGESPTHCEDKFGQPLVGDAGDLFNGMIGAIGLKLEDVYVTNVVKCSSIGRDPSSEETQQCSSFIQQQIQIIKPEVIVLLGRFATQALLGAGKTRVGEWTKFGGIPVMPTFHPVFLLDNPEAKRDAFADFQAVINYLIEVGQ